MTSAPVPVTIVGYDPRHAADFARLNRQWLEFHDLLEAADLEYLEKPHETIVATGGEVFLALLDGRVVGTCAAIVPHPGTVELARLTTDAAWRGRGIGRRLTEEAIAWARRRGARRVILVSSTRLVPALRLYERLGFSHRPLPRDTPYATADVCMELRL